ncbi:MAG: hypothetical protein EXQ55_10630 [Acidobacteria bacterium]|nr:hypothetical protein [Acidobacteriota bacterium]
MAKQSENLDYECVPLSCTNGYNSNSYLRGLLEAAGLGKSQLPLFPDRDRGFVPDPVYPGWSKPVPKVHFEPFQLAP